MKAMMMTTMMMLMITASDAYCEGVQRASNARELRASRSTKKHGRIECIFFSPSKPRRVLEAFLAFSFTGEIFHVFTLTHQVSFSSNITRYKE